MFILLFDLKDEIKMRGLRTGMGMPRDSGRRSAWDEILEKRAQMPLSCENIKT